MDVLSSLLQLKDKRAIFMIFHFYRIATVLKQLNERLRENVTLPFTEFTMYKNYSLPAHTFTSRLV